ncbi:hypothetical protein Gotri_004171 [Gossypium trilobum]|uniref:Uncharacterized protein n=1 Tax=Gossypium trilobum TaxID=34281 RepID=A0A7J9F517_9ROSI|nr:hypothetical protein [Gossypium trilobum]
MFSWANSGGDFVPNKVVSLDLSYQRECHWRNDQSYDPFYPALKLEKPNFKTFMKNMRSLRELYLDGVNI